MLIVLPPSETKSVGGNGSPLNLEELSFPTLTDTRADILDDLIALSADQERAMEVLKLGPRLADEVTLNGELRISPTMAAIDRYTGVLYDALDASSLSNDARGQLAIGSALFGVVGAEDMIPHYRLSGTVKLPRRVDGTTPTLKSRWGKQITAALSNEDLLIDLRSGTYQNLGKVTEAITVTVVTEEGKVVSHFNKHYKGVLARVLVASKEKLETIEDIIEIGTAAGLTLKQEGLRSIVMTAQPK